MSIARLLNPHRYQVSKPTKNSSRSNDRPITYYTNFNMLLIGGETYVDFKPKYDNPSPLLS